MLKELFRLWKIDQRLLRPNSSLLRRCETTAIKPYVRSIVVGSPPAADTPVPRRKRNEQEKIVQFLDWMMRDGQKQASALHYAPLPSQVIAKETVALKKVTGADGAPLLTAR